MQKPAVTLMVKAARSAGNVLLRHMNKLDALNIVEKDRMDYASEVDGLAEKEIIKEFRRSTPDYAILGEETGSIGHNRFTWVIDPLDGTSNYVRGHPFFAVSIALLEDETPVLGVVYDVIHDECFTAARDDVARLNGAPIAVAATDPLQHALLSTGFPYDRWSRPDTNLPEVQALVMQCHDLRRMDSAALDLCAVALGRSDGHWEVELKPWDSAAGALIVERAGGRVTNLQGGPYRPWTPGVVATNGRLHPALLAALADAQEATR